MSIELVILSNHLFTLISFRIDWFDLLATQGTQKSLLLKALQFETISSLVLSLLYGPVLTLVCGYWKSHSFDLWSFVGKVMFPLLNMLSRFIIVFLQRSKDLLFHGFSHHPQWFESLRKENLSLIPLLPLLFGMKRLDTVILLGFWMLNFKPAFSLCSLILIRRLFSSSSLSAVRVEWYPLHIWGCWYVSQQCWSQLVLHAAWHFGWWTLCIS